MVIDKDIRDTRYIHLLELTTQSIYAVRAILYIIYYTYIYIYIVIATWTYITVVRFVKEVETCMKKCALLLIII